MRTRSREALGIYTDGLDIKVAHVRMQSGKLEVLALRSATLEETFESSVQEDSIPEDRNGAGVEDDIFGFDSDQLTATDIGDAVDHSNQSVLLSLLEPFALDKVLVGVNLNPSEVSYSEHPAGVEYKKRSVRRKIIASLSEQVNRHFSEQNFSFLRGADGRIFSVVEDGCLPLINSLEELRDYLGGKPMRFALVEPNETVLMNWVRRTVPREEKEDYTAVLYIGTTFSRIMLLDRGELLHVQPVINEGFSTSSVCERLHRKLRFLLDQDVIPRLTRIILAGEIESCNAKEYYEQELSDISIEEISTGELNMDQISEVLRVQFAAYCIPIALAVRCLTRASSWGTPVNFLPPSFQDRSRTVHIAWHGWLMLFVLLIGVSFISYRGLAIGHDVTLCNNDAQFGRETLQSWQELLEVSERFNKEVRDFQSYMTMISSIKGSILNWSHVLEDISSLAHETGAIWIRRIEGRTSGFVVYGIAENRDAIVALANKFDAIQIRQVDRTVIEDKQYLSFSLGVNQELSSSPVSSSSGEPGSPSEKE